MTVKVVRTVANTNLLIYWICY